MNAIEIIEAKISLLEHYFSEGIPQGAFTPTSLESFRTWEDKTAGILKIGSKATIYNTNVSSQIKKAKELIRLLKQNNRKPIRKIKNHEKNSKKNKDLENTVKSLATQLTKLREDYNKILRENESKENIINNKNIVISELRKKIIKVRPLKYYK